MRASRYLAIGVSVLSVAGAVACGGGGGNSTSSGSVTTENWANSICSSVSSWATAVKSAAAPIKSGNLSKPAIESALTSVGKATDTLVSDLKGLGKPNTSAGQQAKNAVAQLRSELQPEVEAIKSASTSKSGLSQVSAITGTLATMGGQISSTVSKLKSIDAKGELTKAFKNAPACKQLEKTLSG